MSESTTAPSAPDKLLHRQQQQEQQQEEEQQLTQPRGAHLLTSTTKSHRQATNEALAADDSTPSGQEKSSFMCFPISRISHIKSSMAFFWPKKREETKPAPASSSMETPSHQPQTPSHPKDCNTMGDSEVDFDKMYAEERKDLKYDFKEKKPEIQEQFKEFWSRPRAKEDVDAYYNCLPEKADADANYKGPTEKEDADARSKSAIEKKDADAHSDGPSKGSTDPKPYHYNEGRNPEGNWVKSSTAFTGYADDPGNVGNIFVSNKDVLIVGNFASFDIAQYPGNSSPAGMSAVHLLGLTRERIYNGVSLPKEKIHLLNDIKELFAKSWSGQEFREKVIRHQLNRIKKQYDKTGNKEGYELAREHYKELEEEIHRLKVENFKFGLHLFPDHSVGHFHMHIVAMTREMRQWSTSKHDMKTKDVDEVREAIQTFDRNTKTFDESKVAKITE